MYFVNFILENSAFGFSNYAISLNDYNNVYFVEGEKIKRVIKVNEIPFGLYSIYKIKLSKSSYIKIKKFLKYIDKNNIYNKNTKNGFLAAYILKLINNTYCKLPSQKYTTYYICKKIKKLEKEKIAIPIRFT